MSILNSASSRSVYRGYDYYKEGNVVSYAQLSDFEFEGEVKGTNKTPYNVIINIEHPKKSSCSCPFANGNTICKHMVALFFAVSPEDLKDYEDWSENDYEYEYEYEENAEDYYDDCEYDGYGNYNKYRSDFAKPIYFDELLSNFVDNLPEEKLKNSPKFEYYINKLINNTKDIIALERIYIFLDKKEDLFKLLLKKENEYRLIDNIENLKDDYNNEIFMYLKNRFYEEVALEKSRENYHKTLVYFKGIKKLNDGEKLINDFINELKKSEYSKRTALFDEIYNAIMHKQ